jgi:hypothetical protein
MRLPWYNVFTWWVMAALAFTNWPVRALLYLNLIGTIIGQILRARRWGWEKLNKTYFVFIILLHAIPIRYAPAKLDLLFTLAFFAIYGLFLEFQGTNPLEVYEGIIEEPPEMDMIDYVKRRFYFHS